MRRQIAEWLFESLLDEDFNLGIREGHRRAKIQLVTELSALLESAPKSKKAGIEDAIEVVKQSWQ